MPHPSLEFEKAAEPPLALLQHLEAKGLEVGCQRAKAIQALEFIGYHRLLIYMRPLQDPQKLSCLFADMHLDHRKTVAAKFGYDESVLSTWLQSLTLLRNVCAHHGRLWNASITAGAPKYAKAVSAEFPCHSDRGRVFARAVVVQALLKRIHPTSDWGSRFKVLMEAAPATVLAKAGRTIAELGVVPGWEARAFWD